MTCLRYTQVSCVSNRIRLEGKIALHSWSGGSPTFRRENPAPPRDCIIKGALETQAKPAPQRAGLLEETGCAETDWSSVGDWGTNFSDGRPMECVC